MLNVVVPGVHRIMYIVRHTIVIKAKQALVTPYAPVAT